ncbi:hypothetical protein BST61_g9819 [Cercospora zeina]
MPTNDNHSLPFDHELPYNKIKSSIMLLRIFAWTILGIWITMMLGFVAMCVRHGAGGRASMGDLDLETGREDMQRRREADGYRDCPPAYAQEHVVLEPPPPPSYEESDLVLQLPPSYAESEAGKHTTDEHHSNTTAHAI